jgi:hypothetical protein
MNQKTASLRTTRNPPLGLHIVQGGADNGDKRALEGADGTRRKFKTWVLPKCALPGDEVVIYVTKFGFFATGRIISKTRPHPSWKNRYSAQLSGIRLIRPPISLNAIRRGVPGLKWANYPRSITSPDRRVSGWIRKLIHKRRKFGLINLNYDFLNNANFEELRRAALMRARRRSPAKMRKTIYRMRSRAVYLYVLRRADGKCEACKVTAPFIRKDGTPYLEPHHTTRLADDGPDHPKNVIGLCPACHRRAHHAQDAHVFNQRLVKKARLIERSHDRR